MKIAVQGCAHGELEKIYNTIAHIEQRNKITIDLLLCCGDFQATRNLNDLNSMAVPPKFRHLCTFYKYYSGEKLAPKLTIFIGGNHEASNYLQELPYGGWVAPNIYYMGYAGVVNVGGVRIAGISGIFKGWDFSKGRYEKPPYNDETLRSCYHIRNLDVFRLKQLSGPIHIMMSHDWPAGITNYGDVQQLLKDKPFFKQEIESETLGNKPMAELLEHMKPDYWFSAHLHVKFAALVKHCETESKSTKFLALDKCLPRRKFLQILDIPHQPGSEFQLKYDLEWLTILHLTNHLISIKKLNSYMPGPGCIERDFRWDFSPKEEELNLIMNKIHGNLNVPNNFVPTAPAHNSNADGESDFQFKLNPQTTKFCEKICVDDPMLLLLNESDFHNNSSLNLSNNDYSSFVGHTDSEIEAAASETKSELPKTRISDRTPLKLPNPNFQISDEFDNNVFTSTPLEKKEAPLLESSLCNDSETETLEVEKKVDTEGPDAKKFRRRNLALYASSEEN